MPKQERSVTTSDTMGKDILPSPIWRKIIKKLNDMRVEYILVGGSALIVHGLPRSTLDIDIYVSAKEDTLGKLFQIAEDLGLDTDQRDILKIRHMPHLFANQWICFSNKGQEILDVFFVHENKFTALYRNSELRKDQHICVRVASLNDISAMKRASRRAIDRADLILIEEVRKQMRRSKRS